MVPYLQFGFGYLIPVCGCFCLHYVLPSYLIWKLSEATEPDPGFWFGCVHILFSYTDVFYDVLHYRFHI